MRWCWMVVGIVGFLWGIGIVLNVGLLFLSRVVVVWFGGGRF